MYWLRMQSPLLLGVALLALGCGGSDSTGPSIGNVQVTASTTGADLDPDGYTVAVDGGAGRSLAVNGTVTFSQLSAGDHTVTLSGIAANCTPSGQNPRTVAVSAGAAAQTVFQVACAQPAAIAFLSFRGSDQTWPALWVANADGSGATRIAAERTGFGAHSWSPRGDQLAFLGGSDSASSGLYVANVDGTGIRRLTNTPWDANGRNVAWSPDGSKITFQDYEAGIVVVNADGTGLDTLGGAGPYLDWEARKSSWSPDGKKIAYADFAPDGWSEIYVMNADGSARTRVTYGCRGPDNTLCDQNTGPAWSPDGTKIAYQDQHYDPNKVPSLIAYIHVIRSDGTGDVNLTAALLSAWHPSWSPDGARLAFWAPNGGSYEIYLMNADGSGLVQLVESSSYACNSWSADGTKLAYCFQGDVYSVGVDGKGVVNLTNNPALDIAPLWSPRR